MNRRSTLMLMMLLCLTAMAATLSSCSDDDDPTIPGGGEQAFAVNDFAQDMRDVLPPEFVAEPFAKGIEDDPWLEGDHPLLGKVIGSEDDLDNPTCIYHNVTFIDFYQDCLETVLAAEAPAGTLTVATPMGWDVSIAYQLHAVPATIALPVGCRGQFGVDSVDIDGHVTFSGVLDCPDFPDPMPMALQIGWAQEGDVQDLLVFLELTGESVSLTLSSKNEADGGFRVCAADVGQHAASGEIYGHWHEVGGLADGGFVYNMAWYSNQAGDGECFCCVNGSGDADAEFGLRFHQLDALNDWVGIDPNWGPFERIFGLRDGDPYADVSAEAQYPISHYVDNDAMYGHDEVCTAVFDSPFPG